MSTADDQTEIKKAKLCDLLLRTSAIRFGVFTLTSGKLSPYYIDLRVVPSSPEAFRSVIEVYADVAKTSVGLDSFGRIAGIPTAGISYASVLSYVLRKPFLYVRREAKLHGRERRIEGLLSPGDNVLIVDDLVTTGKSTVSAVEALRAEGAIVTDSVVLIDREEKGRENLERSGVKLHSFMKVSELAKRLRDRGAIDEEQYQGIVRVGK